MKLTEQIIKHIFFSFGILQSEDFNVKSFQSLLHNEFLLNKTIKFEVENNNTIENNLWGCQLDIEGQQLKIIVGDTSREKDIKEYCLIVHLEKYPIYGIYLSTDINDPQALIGYSINGSNWNNCSIYLQATFLAALEKIKDYILIPKACNHFDDEYKAMLSFITFHTFLF